MMKVYRKAVLPLYFKASAVSCGIKRSGKPDLALLYSIVPAHASCQFTSNKIQAAPIKLNKKYLKSGRNFQAIIVNSGNANAFTGNTGIKDAEETAKAAAEILSLKKNEILVNSTGIIGKRLPVANIKKAIVPLAKGLSAYGISLASRAIMTTDTFSKEVTVKFNIGNKVVTICGIAKGAGMIAPDMATMLCFILTDADITKGALDKALDICVDDSFNCITVDGCMSTNDSVMVLANGAAANSTIDNKKNFNVFLAALKVVCVELAKLIVKDGEGASKFIKISVHAARSFKDAKMAALNIANSNLFKTAVYGENPNFGRIISAAGSSGAFVKEQTIKVKVSPLDKRDINVDVFLGVGKSSATVYTSDLTPEYIKINAEYN